MNTKVISLFFLCVELIDNNVYFRKHFQCSKQFSVRLYCAEAISFENLTKMCSVKYSNAEAILILS